MKKLFRNSLMLSALGSVLLFTACDDSLEDVVDTTEAPTVSVTTDETLYTAGTDAQFDISFEAQAGIVGATISVSSDNGVNFNPIVLDLNEIGVANDTIGNFSVNITIPEEAVGSTATVSVEIEDSEARTAESSVSFEVSSAINSFTAVLLGGQLNDNTGSFFDAVTGTVRTVEQAFQAENTNQNDFVFWYGNTSGYAIGAVDDATAQTAFENVGVMLENLNPKSLTRFKEFVGTVDFDAIGSESQLQNAYQTDGSANLTSMKDLAPNDVFGIVLDDSRGSRIGLVKVISVSGTSGAERAITIDVKIQATNN